MKHCTLLLCQNKDHIISQYKMPDVNVVNNMRIREAAVRLNKTPYGVGASGCVDFYLDEGIVYFAPPPMLQACSWAAGRATRAAAGRTRREVNLLSIRVFWGWIVFRHWCVNGERVSRPKTPLCPSCRDSAVVRALWPDA